MSTCDVIYNNTTPIVGALDPDIMGIGVLISFMATAYLTLIVLCICFIVHFVPDDFMNNIDNGVVNTLWGKRRSRPAKSWASSLQTMILMYSDQQLVTGLAILISGYAQLSQGISCYHWQVIVYLAWFSSITHLTTLSFLRQYFRENTAARYWRAILMAIMVAMLGIALLPTGDAQWDKMSYSNAGALPVLCTFKRLSSQSSEPGYEFNFIASPTMITSIMVLSLSYSTRLIKFSQHSSTLRNMIRTKPGQVIKRALAKSIHKAKQGKKRILWRLAHLFLETLYVELRAILDIYESLLWEILWLGFGLGWGTSRLLLIRDFGRKARADDEKNKDFGFGQILPVVLLALPLFSLGQNFYEKRKSLNRESEQGTQTTGIAAEAEPNHDSRQSQFLRIGLWPVKQPNLPSGFEAVQGSHNSIARTGTELQNEEIHMGEISSHPTSTSRPDRSNESQADMGQNNLPPFNPTDVSQQSRKKHIDSPYNYYQFEWFRILIGMILVLSIEPLLDVIIERRNGIDLAFSLATTIIGSLAASTLYAMCFVIFTEYHGVLSQFIQKYTTKDSDSPLTYNDFEEVKVQNNVSSKIGDVAIAIFPANIQLLARYIRKLKNLKYIPGPKVKRGGIKESYADGTMGSLNDDEQCTIYLDIRGKCAVLPWVTGILNNLQRLMMRELKPY
ncbi:uncharacterized protein KY384_006764 [Bacidia gigantensis]|uniref:uncharacterized protein n=1 Tax=Bacidia gigantensis TaxID=2732470 RepID=UPI001D04628D|nr:uncharacterized protein KY384_006764 [Bacidia gigantensis]KAG8527848.1 hypothetical protein KY384_006764 [Bacidia gigantensis]